MLKPGDRFGDYTIVRLLGKDGMGGNDGMFKGFLSQARYVFPLWLADKSKGERFEVLGHVIGEWFNPGDYFETEKPMFFFRWQVEFKF